MSTDVEAIVRQFVTEVEGAAGGVVQSIVLYGSAGAGDHVPGRSDLNFLLVAPPRIDVPLLQALQGRMKRWAKHRISTPLVVDQEFLLRSMDSYPLEILGMIATKRVVYGSDPLQGLLPKARDVRVQVEREAKSKELLLRRGFLESFGKDRVLLGFLLGAGPAIEAILRGLLFLSGGEWAAHGARLADEAQAKLGIDLSALREIRAIRAGGAKPDRPSTFALYGRTLELVARLAGHVDRVSIEEDR